MSAFLLILHIYFLLKYIKKNIFHVKWNFFIILFYVFDNDRINFSGQYF